ncbi:hypothetical protein NL676_024994 [Syzygium grande]|nr:hypothetical protein NL676_024994 [Syzygium grande]
MTLIACSYRQRGMSHLVIIDLLLSSLSSLDIPFVDIQDITSGNNCLYIEGASGVLPTSVARLLAILYLSNLLIFDEVTFNDEKSEVIDFQIIWSSSPDSPKYDAYFSLPELIEFPTEVPGQNAYAYFYPPSNQFYQASQEEKPPLLLKSHGGPARETRGALSLSIQYWTSRGWAFVDVNYGGSTGYGREFRERLLGRWGIVDVDDCCSCAKFLVESRKVDGNRLCITGVSAGGHTTFAALAFRETFRAGASLYGKHKFESHYLDNFVVSEKDCYERSPINSVKKFSCPIILFQGLYYRIRIEAERSALNTKASRMVFARLRISNSLWNSKCCFLHVCLFHEERATGTSRLQQVHFLCSAQLCINGLGQCIGTRHRSVDN